jgi:hypothetical protein
MVDQKPKAVPRTPQHPGALQRTNLRRMLGLNSMPFGPLRWLLPLAFVALVTAAVVRTLGIALDQPPSDAWVYPLLIALALGVVLSIPLVNLLAIAAGAWLIQPLMFLSAMVLLAYACWLGAQPWWFGMLPALFVLVWAGQAIAGRVLIRKLNRAGRQVERIELADAAPVLARLPDWPSPLTLLEASGLSELWVETKPLATGYLRLTPAEVDGFKALTGGNWPSGWGLHDLTDGAVLHYQAPLPDRVIRLQQDRWRARSGLLGTPLHRIRVQGREDLQLVWGRSAPVFPLPLFQLFFWSAVFDEPSRGQVGFMHGKPRLIGPDPVRLDHLLALPDDPQPLRLARFVQARRLLAQVLRQRQQAVDALVVASLTNPMPGGKHGPTLSELSSVGPALLGDEAGPVLLAWFCRAHDARSLEGVKYVASLLARLDDDALRRIGPDLYNAINSRKLLLQWTIGPDFDPTPLPPATPVFGKKAGFGLLHEQPRLFMRMGDCYPGTRALMAELAKECDLPRELQQALERWKADAQGIPA